MIDIQNIQFLWGAFLWGVLDEPYSGKPAQRRSRTGPPGYIGWTQFQPMQTGRPISVWQLRWAGLADYKVRLKLPPLYCQELPSWETQQRHQLGQNPLTPYCVISMMRVTSACRASPPPPYSPTVCTHPSPSLCYYVSKLQQCGRQICLLFKQEGTYLSFFCLLFEEIRNF